MTINSRFGRKLPIPSTRQIRHELIVFGMQEEARRKEDERRKAAEAPVPAVPQAGDPLL